MMGCQKFVETLGLGQNGRHFPDDIFKCILLNENIWISIEISLKFVLRGPFNNIPALVQIMMFSLLTHICVTQPQWVKTWTYLKPVMWLIYFVWPWEMHRCWNCVRIHMLLSTFYGDGLILWNVTLTSHECYGLSNHQEFNCLSNCLWQVVPLTKDN